MTSRYHVIIIARFLDLNNGSGQEWSFALKYGLPF